VARPPAGTAAESRLGVEITTWWARPSPEAIVSPTATNAGTVTVRGLTVWPRTVNDARTWTLVAPPAGATPPEGLPVVFVGCVEGTSGGLVDDFARVAVASPAALVLEAAVVVVLEEPVAAGDEEVVAFVDGEPPDPPHAESVSADASSARAGRLMRRRIETASCPGMAIALLATHIMDYRTELYERLAERHDVEVLCTGGGRRYVPGWFSDLDAQIAGARFPARRVHGPAEALRIARRYEATIAPFAGGAVLPAAYAGARRAGKPFVLWASVWSQPRSAAHALSLPVVRDIYRHADAIVAYGEHVRRFVARIRGRDEDIYVAPQAVEAALFGRTVDAEDVRAFRSRHGLGERPIVLYVGRLVREKGIGVLGAAWPRVASHATLVAIGEGRLAGSLRGLEHARVLGPMPRAALPVAYAASELVVVPSIPTPRFLEPWGLVCNEAMHQGRPVIASAAVGAVAGGLVRDGVNGVVLVPGDAAALARAIDGLLADPQLSARLGAAARRDVAPFNYDAMEAAFDRALATAFARRRG
jgi:glycosyltransferase involved in cell wall biosynthesis